MSTQKVYYETLSPNRKKIYKKQLEQDGKYICLGMLCRGKILNIKEFPYRDMKKCKTCHKESLLFASNRTLKKINRNVKFERKVNREIIKEWKELKCKN